MSLFCFSRQLPHSTPQINQSLSFLLEKWSEVDCSSLPRQRGWFHSINFINFIQSIYFYKKEESLVGRWACCGLSSFFAEHWRPAAAHNPPKKQAAPPARAHCAHSSIKNKNNFYFELEWLALPPAFNKEIQEFL